MILKHIIHNIFKIVKFFFFILDQMLKNTKMKFVYFHVKHFYIDIAQFIMEFEYKKFLFKVNCSKKLNLISFLIKLNRIFLIYIYFD